MINILLIDQHRGRALTQAIPIARWLDTSGTTVGVPTSGVLSGISSEKEELSVLPQLDTQVAADIPALQQGQRRGFLQSQDVPQWVVIITNILINVL